VVLQKLLKRKKIPWYHFFVLKKAYPTTWKHGNLKDLKDA
jgi:hypothetical protein